jgi:hypothetical protein
VSATITTSAEKIAALRVSSALIETHVRHLVVRLDAATLAAEDLDALRVEVATLSHQVASLRTAIEIVNDVQDRIDGGPPSEKAAAP